MSPDPDTQTRQRAHVERMLARAEKRSRHARKLVEKWQTRLAELNREGVTAKQPRLWEEANAVCRGTTPWSEQVSR